MFFTTLGRVFAAPFPLRSNWMTTGLKLGGGATGFDCAVLTTIFFSGAGGGVMARVPELRDSRGDNDAPKEEGEGTILR